MTGLHLPDMIDASVVSFGRITRNTAELQIMDCMSLNITKATKIRLVQTLVCPIFLYAAETWTLRLVEKKKIDALEMWCWRRMLGVSWTEFRTNISILQEIGIKKRLSALVQSRILKFFGHVSRRESDSIGQSCRAPCRVDGPIILSLLWVALCTSAPGFRPAERSGGCSWGV
ncbi:jg15810 [Pararge aegeria aegeria]|uniref:Jg15810 protein n=1 Tax=Pararge aegeria aegeria TaxID=348720 RepID=A0A8S4SBM7_9NEOP|nr:jg15810 [Pararge aegeria aegeria]